MSKRTVIAIVAVSACLLVAAIVLLILGDPNNVAPILVIVSSLGSLVAIIGNSFRRAREEPS